MGNRSANSGIDADALVSDSRSMQIWEHGDLSA
jgi:hypothetical protein